MTYSSWRFIALVPIVWGLSGCATVAVAQTEEPATGPSTQVEQARRQLTEADLKVLKWRSIGPANMGGRVAAIALAPGNSKTFFVGFATGGLFKTTNRGTTLTPVFDQEVTSSIGSVAVVDAPVDWPGWADEPDEPNDNDSDEPIDRNKAGKAKIVWVGTGEGNGRNSSSWGHGVYRSTDGGTTFENVGLADSHDIPQLAVDPRNPDVCYVAALGHLWGSNKERGIYKTTDGGKHWQAVLQIDENTGAIDVLINPDSPDVVYAAMYSRRRTAYSFQSGSKTGGIFRSTDAGVTWSKLTNGLPSQTGRMGLDIYRKNPSVLYAVIESDVGGHSANPFAARSRSGGVFRTDDGGDTWRRMSDISPRPFYFSKVRIDPKDDQRIYLLSTLMAISDDGGKHFRAGGKRRPHVDMHAMIIDPDDPDHLTLGTDGGLYVSYDRAKTWDFINSVAVGQFYNIAVDMSDPYRVGGGLQDNGSWIGPSATIRNDKAQMWGKAGGITNQDWQFINNGDGFHVAFDPVDPNIVYAESQGGLLVRVHLDTGLRKMLKPSPKEGQPHYRFNWNAPFFISPHNPTTLYLGGNYVFKFTNRGDQWERISEDLSTKDIDKATTIGSDAETNGTVVSLAESPLRAGLLWAGTDDGLVHITTNDGASWTNITPPQLGGLYVSKIEPSYHDEQTAYLAIDGHRSDDFSPRLLKTTDAGTTWQSIAGDLPDGAPVKVIREDRKNAHVLYVGTERACYVSIDGGQRWVKLNGKTLPTVAVDDIKQHPRAFDLVAGTHGRSIYILDDASPLSSMTPELLQKEFHLFEPLSAKPIIYLPYWGLWGDRIFTASNPDVGARITYWLRSYTDEDISISITDDKGVAVRKLTGTNRPGFNRVVWDLQAEKHNQFDNPDAFLGQTQFVPAGQYTITVKYGKKHAKTKVTVLAAPGMN